MNLVQKLLLSATMLGMTSISHANVPYVCENFALNTVNTKRRMQAIRLPLSTRVNQMSELHSALQILYYTSLAACEMDNEKFFPKVYSIRTAAYRLNADLEAGYHPISKTIHIDLRRIQESITPLLETWRITYIKNVGERAAEAHLTEALKLTNKVLDE